MQWSHPLTPTPSHGPPCSLSPCLQSQAYAEVEVMKMIMPLISSAAGKVFPIIPEGSPLSVGDVIANLELDDLK